MKPSKSGNAAIAYRNLACAVNSGQSTQFDVVASVSKLDGAGREERLVQLPRWFQLAVAAGDCNALTAQAVGHTYSSRPPIGHSRRSGLPTGRGDESVRQGVLLTRFGTVRHVPWGRLYNVKDAQSPCPTGGEALRQR